MQKKQKKGTLFYLCADDAILEFDKNVTRSEAAISGGQPIRYTSASFRLSTCAVAMDDCFELNPPKGHLSYE
ncbi:MAG: hypothetical protein JXR91_07935 [Deltaproteobacteria bacterium]|nr:hypothetical protein [Deltaproteobacteria bacterium]